jgi:predicted nuclease of predicted toxin-antitoxin system
MKILLDENLPKKLKITFAPEREVYTVREKNWNGKRNGELLGLMTLDGFDAFITIDKNL